MKLKIAVLAGDGIGPEVTAQAIKSLKAIADVYGHSFEFQEALVGACAIDATGNPLPKETLSLCEQSDAVLLVPLDILNMTTTLQRKYVLNRDYLHYANLWDFSLIYVLSKPTQHY